MREQKVNEYTNDRRDRLVMNINTGIGNEKRQLNKIDGE
jgi:hypothetical protein